MNLQPCLNQFMLILPFIKLNQLFFPPIPLILPFGLLYYKLLIPVSFRKLISRCNSRKHLLEKCGKHRMSFSSSKGWNVLYIKCVACSLPKRLLNLLLIRFWTVYPNLSKFLLNYKLFLYKPKFRDIIVCFYLLI